ncbi:hypothetical protein CgunFtcFv8_023023 [Champsocephalus gunnari]|uniref:Uncharacterized protein n=1 Tax=Champsocephalus gunnari TaxID=52237 RepID=A0AAN8DBJ7_CHAGU|nr:hypothetical protein CgunFtcFv8_023023 [Champsocephalus gunnari]
MLMGSCFLPLIMDEDAWWPWRLHVRRKSRKDIYVDSNSFFPPSPGGGSHKLSLRLMSPLAARVKRKGGEGNEEGVEDGECSQG